jgi:hypothetical protein
MIALRIVIFVEVLIVGPTDVDTIENDAKNLGLATS